MIEKPQTSEGNHAESASPTDNTPPLEDIADALNKTSDQSASPNDALPDPDGLDAVLKILDIGRGSRRYSQQKSPPSSPRGSIRLKNPPTSPRGSVRLGPISNSGSANSSLRARRASRPALPDFSTASNAKERPREEDLKHQRQIKVEEIKQRVLQRRESKLKEMQTNHTPHLVESSSPLLSTTTPQTRYIELRLHGIHENSDDKDIRIITDDSMSVVISMLDQLAPTQSSERSVVTRIDLQKNKIGGKGAKLLCDHLLNRPGLEILDVSNNKQLLSEIPITAKNLRNSSGLIGAEGYIGANAFKKLLEEYASLALLMMNDCGLTDMGASFIASGLKNNASIVFLDMGYNKFSDTGASYLCDALIGHQTIRHILFDGNHLTDNSAQQMLDLVQTNTRILTLEINDMSGISEQLAKKIKAQVNANRAAYIKLEETPKKGGTLESEDHTKEVSCN